MRLMDRLRRFVFCAILAAASSAGAPMRTEEVEELMRAASHPKVAHILRREDEDDDSRCINRHRSGSPSPHF